MCCAQRPNCGDNAALCDARKGQAPRRHPLPGECDVAGCAASNCCSDVQTCAAFDCGKYALPHTLDAQTVDCRKMWLAAATRKDGSFDAAAAERANGFPWQTAPAVSVCTRKMCCFFFVADDDNDNNGKDGSSDDGTIDVDKGKDDTPTKKGVHIPPGKGKKGGSGGHGALVAISIVLVLVTAVAAFFGVRYFRLKKREGIHQSSAFCDANNAYYKSEKSSYDRARMAKTTKSKSDRSISSLTSFTASEEPAKYKPPTPASSPKKKPGHRKKPSRS
jgi:hypothetical protein